MDKSKEIVRGFDKDQVLLNSLLKKPDVSGSVRRTLGGDFVKELFEIMHCNMVIEPDWLMLTGQMSLEQAEQYVALSGDYERVIDRLNKLVSRMFDAYVSKLPSLIERDTRGKNSEGLFNLFDSVHQLEKYTPSVFQGIPNLYTGYFRSFVMNLYSLLGVELIRISRSSDYKDHIRKYADFFIGYMNDQFRATAGLEFVGIQLFNEMLFYRSAFERKDNLGELDETIGYRKLSLEERDGLSDSCKKMCNDVFKEASYKKILLHECKESCPQIVFLGDEVATNAAKYSGFCAFRINFNKDHKVGVPNIINPMPGVLCYDFRNIDGVVNFHLNPYSGELTLITNNGVNLNRVLDSDRYVLLKSYLIKQLYDYLSSKDPDLDDVINEGPLKICGEVSHSVADVVENKGEDNNWSYVPYEEKRSDVVNDFVEQGDISSYSNLPKKLKKLVMDKIWGAKGSEIFSAIKRLLGDSVRQRGSHMYFFSDRTNQVLPIPNHDVVAIPLLLNNLHEWGIDRLEFARALGVKYVR